MSARWLPLAVGLLLALGSSEGMAEIAAPQPDELKIDSEGIDPWAGEAVERAAPSEVDVARRAVSRQTPMAERLQRLTAPLLGLPYVDSPLGEEEGVDADPRLRWDAFDCLTFVETAMALATTPPLAPLLPEMDAIRYAATPASFINRNHFMEAQWLPNNLLSGRLREISREVAGEKAVAAQKEFSLERWRSRRSLREMPLPEDAVPRGRFSLSMVPLAEARARAQRIPSGTLLVVVRSDFRSQPTRITHVGLVLETARGQVLRHAARAPYHRVIDEPLEAFLLRNSRYTRWPVEGVALYEIVDPPQEGFAATGG